MSVDEITRRKCDECLVDKIGPLAIEFPSGISTRMKAIQPVQRPSPDQRPNSSYSLTG